MRFSIVVYGYAKPTRQFIICSYAKYVVMKRTQFPSQSGVFEPPIGSFRTPVLASNKSSETRQKLFKNHYEYIRDIKLLLWSPKQALSSLDRPEMAQHFDAYL